MDGPIETRDSRTPWLAVAGICLAVAAVYWCIDSRSTLWDRDEPRFARATAEMIESGNYLYPTFNGRLRPDKPILIYWLMSIPMRALGPTSLACRFFSSVGIAFTCLFTFLLARRFLGLQAGLWSMVVLSSTLLIMVEGTLATADGILLPCMVTVMVLFGHALEWGWRWYQVATLGLALGLGLLAKGPVALLPVVVIIATLWLIREQPVRLGPYFGPLGGAVVMGMLVFVVWAIPANNATGGEFLRLGLGHHVLARTAKPLESHGGRFLLYLPYYPLIIIAAFFPWTLHLPGSISAVLRGRVGRLHFRELFLVWVVSIVVIMTLVATKLPHYILFIWPALAMAVGGTLAADARGKLADVDRNWLRGGIYFFAPVAGLAVVAFFAAPFWLHLSGAIVPFAIAGVVLLLVSVLAMRQQLQNRPQASAATLLAGMVVLQFPVMLGVMPALERTKISPTLAQAITQQTTSDVPIFTYGYGEPTLNFYLGRRIEPLAHEQAVVRWTQQLQPGVLVITKPLFDDIERRHGPLHLAEIASQRGLNYAKGKPLEVVALLRQGRNP